ncbi:site-specific integrase [Paraburkholderia terricola]|uniref:Phage integrase family protein n=1 Tax=Paraburkholderia terricola TaxID=169427 RepID=A0A1M6RJJ0_9BURK|nr:MULTISPECIES: site-specific integrase [Paraburkholderia]SDO50458.1 Phage integrase family protein [Paraburkholderia sediminicola]SHK32594.1 Phage integrase family protein [Paraburkholderia terricola]
MGTITPRENKDGSTSYKAQVRVRKGGKVLHQETKTFERRQAAQIWIKQREAALSHADGLKAALQENPPVKEMIKRYIAELGKPLDRTKRMILNQISGSTLGEVKAAQLESADIVAYMRTVEVAPSTRGHYLAHLSSVITLARPAWGYPVDASVVADARVALTRMGLVGRSKHRERRPTLDEMDRLMAEFGKVRDGTPDSIPMQALAAFTIFSLRRISEICRLRWGDLDEDGCRVMVRDLKHPNTKVGNDTWVDLTPEALRIVKAQPRVDDRIFPYRALTASTAFTNAVQLLGIDDLHLNDLRHEGASRLSEMGWTIQRVAAVSGHRSWNTLKRYTHVRKVGDKYENWKWLDVIAPSQDYAMPAS